MMVRPLDGGVAPSTVIGAGISLSGRSPTTMRHGCVIQPLRSSVWVTRRRRADSPIRFVPRDGLKGAWHVRWNRVAVLGEQRRRLSCEVAEELIARCGVAKIENG